MATFVAVLVGLSPWALVFYIGLIRWARLKAREKRYVAR